MRHAVGEVGEEEGVVQPWLGAQKVHVLEHGWRCVEMPRPLLLLLLLLLLLMLLLLLLEQL